MNETLYAAVDIGSTKVCTLAAAVRPHGAVEILGMGIAPSRGVQGGMVVAPEETRKAVRQSVEQARKTLGRNMPSVYVGVAGPFVTSTSYMGTWESTDGAEKPISHKEIEWAMASSRPLEEHHRKVLHVLPRAYTVDGFATPHRPLGLPARQLKVESCVIHGDTSPVNNLRKAVEGADVDIKGLVLEHLASSEAVLGGDERELGAILMEIGAEDTSVTVFQAGSVWHTSGIPVGGKHFSNDLSVAFNISPSAAEEVKIRFGQVKPGASEDRHTVDLAGPRPGTKRTVSRGEISRVLRDRAVELIRLGLQKVQRSGASRMPLAGLVLTGGSAKLAGLDELAREFVPCPVRIGTPNRIPGLAPNLMDPAHNACVGMLLWGIKHSEPDLKLHTIGQSGTNVGHWWPRFTSLPKAPWALNRR